ncbi:MAG: hypothetical protein LBC49_03380 [Bacteroidales bacterium]|jgi:hypothetical protein|nr:hypothetical protein [Bacteroidales bacterium]
MEFAAGSNGLKFQSIKIGYNMKSYKLENEEDNANDVSEPIAAYNTANSIPYYLEQKVIQLPEEARDELDNNIDDIPQWEKDIIDERLALIEKHPERLKPICELRTVLKSYYEK